MLAYWKVIYPLKNDGWKMECPFGMVPVQGNFPVHHHGAQIRAKEKMFSDKDWKFKKK